MTWLDVEVDTMRRIATGEASVNLRRCGILDKGALIIAKNLIDTRNTTVKSIDLWDNGIGDRGALGFAELLRTRPDSSTSGLERLVLRNNSIGERGARAIAEALQFNTTLTELDLSHNPIGRETAQQVLHAVKKKTKHGLMRINLQFHTPAQTSFYSKSTNTGRITNASRTEAAATVYGVGCPEPMARGSAAAVESKRALEMLTRKLERENAVVTARKAAENTKVTAEQKRKEWLKAKAAAEKAMYMGTTEEVVSTAAEAERTSKAAADAAAAAEIAQAEEKATNERVRLEREMEEKADFEKKVLMQDLRFDAKYSTRENAFGGGKKKSQNS